MYLHSVAECLGLRAATLGFILSWVTVTPVERERDPISSSRMASWREPADSSWAPATMISPSDASLIAMLCTTITSAVSFLAIGLEEGECLPAGVQWAPRESLLMMSSQ